VVPIPDVERGCSAELVTLIPPRVYDRLPIRSLPRRDGGGETSRIGIDPVSDCHVFRCGSDHNVTKSDQEAPRVIAKLGQMLTNKCSHRRTVVVRSSGIERIVCESCGHVSFSFDGAGPYPVDADGVDLIESSRLSA
jgi:hypothetical protein